ncbi:MAG: cysteine--tRNA ligase [Patescibacteria group bacterium]
MKKIYLYNTLTRQKEEFLPLKKGQISFYYCGPTVYWIQHIGNLRGAVCADLVNRSLSYFGYKVNMVRNYTDVGHLSSDEDTGEDKMSQGASREGLSPQAIAQRYIDIYESDTSYLNIWPPKFRPRATDYIKEDIALVKTLMDKGFAYQTELAIYFSVAKFPDYNRLSGQDLSQNKSQAGRGEVIDPKKKDPADFALWFFKAGVHKKALQFWPSPFYSPLVKDGEGFPGWHLECSALAKKFLGDTIDIHMGGIEHIPVHHTNEIAQSETANGQKFVNYWLHNAHLLVDNKKMSKSAGTSYSLAEIEEKRFMPLALRYFFLQAHYRSNQNFTWEAMKAAQAGLESLYKRVRELGRRAGRADKALQKKFFEALANDFNVPATLALVPEILKSNLAAKDKLATLYDFDRVWGLDLENIPPLEETVLPREVEEIIAERETARRNKHFTRADELRWKLEELGYTVEDAAASSRVSKK